MIGCGLRAAGCGGGAVRANPGLPTAILSPFRALVGRSGWIRATLPKSASTARCQLGSSGDRAAHPGGRVALP